MTRHPFALFLAASFWAWLVFLAWGAGTLTVHDAPGLDFAIYWTAGHMVAAGDALAVFDPDKFWPAAAALIDPDIPYHFWSYPPTALLNVAWLGLLPYGAALAVWSVLGLALVTVAARAFLGSWRPALLLLLSPAVIANLVGGQNGFLTGALLLLAFAALPRREGLAGALIGLLGFKPQLGFLLPVAFVAERRWLAMAAAAGVVLAVAALATVIFGVDAWGEFLRLTVPAQGYMMQGTGPFRMFAPTAFMSGLILGGMGPWPWIAQAPFTVLGVVLTWRAYRSEASPQMKATALFAATLLASPQAFGYDLTPLAAGALILYRERRGPKDLAAAVVLWALPVVVVPLNKWGLPIAPLLLAASAIWIDRRLASPEPASWPARASNRPVPASSAS
jgi:alpha-1,2-mannosyltransferase